MSILLSAHKLEKSFAARTLFQGLSLTLESGERVGLIGPNGAGKSSLLHIIAGRLEPDSGTLSPQRGLRIGYLEQAPTFTPGATIFATLIERASDPHDWKTQSLAHELLSRFDLEKFGLESPVEKLSGGWKKRVALARELVSEPDLLLLDEPTNHLDIESILWLEDFLSKAPFALLTVTHDRVFLQRVSNRIVELDPRHEGGLLSVKGDYAHYLEVREKLINAQEKREVILRNTLRREREWLARGPQARTTKQQARINRAGDLEQNVGDLNERNTTRTALLDFQSSGRSPKKLIEAKAISKSYNGTVLFKDLNLLLAPGTRLGLLGANGCGKSTLIRVLLGLEAPDSGTIQHADGLAVAYYDQSREALDPTLSVAKTVCPAGEHVSFRDNFVHVRSYLDRFLFSSDQMDKPVSKLSGGEQSRLLLARLMLTKAQVLVLDEPTNDLDMATLSVLEDCLCDFSGALILVTHDRYFLDVVSNTLLSFGLGTRPGELVSFADVGQWERYREARKLSAAPVAEVAKPAARPAKVSRKLSYNEQRELDSMESRLSELEKNLSALTAQSESNEVRANSVKLREVSKAMADAQVAIEKLYARWAELESP